MMLFLMLLVGLQPFSPEDAAACVVQSAWLRFRAAQKVGALT